MSESFLEEQLKRIRELSARMSQVTSRMAETSDIIARRETAYYGPLEQVRDLRPHRNQEPPSRREDAADSQPRRKRRRR